MLKSSISTCSSMDSLALIRTGPKKKKSFCLSNVSAARILFIICLIAGAVLLGVFAYRFLTETERNLAQKQFESIADRALDSARDITLRKHLATVTMASIASSQWPSIKSWPTVTIEGFQRIASNLMDISSGENLAFAPLVKPEQLAYFEKFAYNYFATEFPLNENMGKSSFGKGVYVHDRTLNNTDKRSRETDGVLVNSTKTYLVPLLQLDSPTSRAYMMNVRPGILAPILDQIIDCSQNLHSPYPAETQRVRECGEISDILEHRRNEGPSAHIIEPVYPANDPSVLTGFVFSSITWRKALENVFVDEVSGIDCILETEKQKYTYTITGGVASFKGEGDHHDRKYTEYGKKTSITGPPGLYFSNSSVSYNLTLCPSESFFNVYSTNNPNIAAKGAVWTVIITSLLFLLYDFVVRKKFHDNQRILQAKREFVRFVSHEVRTPLNAACMGLQLIQEEIETFLHNYRRENGRGSSSRDLGSKNSSTHSTRRSSSVKAMCKGLVELTDDVVSNTESAVDILNEVLNYDKIEMGTMNLELSEIPIMHLIQRTTNEFSVSAAAKKLNLSLDYSQLADHGACDVEMGSPRPPTNADELSADIRAHRVVGDTIRITQVLRNLLSNALKFTPEEGSVTVAVSIINNKTNSSTKRPRREPVETFTFSSGDKVSFLRSGQLQVTVTDTGAGMSMDQQALLFSAGVQFNRNKLQAGQGSGFGLYISKGIVEQHAGTIGVTSAGLGLGTTFTINLPLYKIAYTEGLPTCSSNVTSFSGSVQISGLPTESSMGRTAGENLNILVVDDSATNRKLLMRLLQKRGHCCEQAEDGEKAVAKVASTKKLGQWHFDTILLDYEMPVMDGPTAAKEIRTLGCDSYIIGVTGNVLPDDVSHFKRCGANDVCHKPVKVDTLENIWVENGVYGRGPIGDDDEESLKG